MRREGGSHADVQGTLDRIRDGDPFTRTGLAQYELLPWAPTIGKEKLDALERLRAP